MCKTPSAFPALSYLSAVARAWGRWKTTFVCVEFIYRNLGVITEIAPTMDTHTTLQIFHADFWVNDAGR
jgi:hypothetical protein